MCFWGCCKKSNDVLRSSQQIDKELKNDKSFNDTIKLLLLGPSGSGKTTLLKQMKILHQNGFTKAEIKETIHDIYNNVHEAIYTLVTNMQKYSMQYSSHRELSCSHFILNLGKLNTKFDQEYAKNVAMLWADKNIKYLYEEKRNQFHLIENARHFLDKADRLFLSNYIPSEADILHSRKVTKAIYSTRFIVEYAGGIQTFEMIDVGGQRSERFKWIQAFVGIHAVFFIASCSDFDRMQIDEPTVRCFDETLKLFSMIWKNELLKQTGIIVFLNKQDVLEEKLNSNKKIEDYLPDFEEFKYKQEEYDSSLSKECNKARYYMKQTFINIAKQPSSNQRSIARGLFFQFTIATNTQNIKIVFNACYNIIKTKHLNEFEIS